MKKIIIILTLLCSLLFVPVFVSAQTAPTSAQITQELIQTLTQLIAQLQKQIQQILAQQQSQANTLNQITQNTTPVTTPAQTSAAAVPSTPPVATSATPIDYSTYTPVSFELYSSNIGAYFNEPISMIGMVDAFLPRGGSGGNTNFIEIINPADPDQPQIVLEIDDALTYTAAVTGLQDKSNPILQFVQAYGIASQSQPMSETNILGSTNVMVPAIKVTRVDKCLHGSMGTTILTGSSLSDVFHCTDWTTIAQ
jgi:hypothetical protein